jgi:hypothetical protein
MSITTQLGRATSVLLSPVVGVVARARRARVLHPRGVVVRAHVVHDLSDPVLGAVAERLLGPALVRLSSAWWKRREGPDALGVAIRFGERDLGEQDLLFATIRSPWTLPIDPLLTDAHDILANDYYAMSPFEVDGLGRVRLRLRPLRSRGGFAGPRDERLARAIAARDASFALEIKRRFGRYRRVACIELREIVEVDQEALRFSPFRAGLGLRPTGFFHGLRAATYAASQAMRPHHS